MHTTALQTTAMHIMTRHILTRTRTITMARRRRTTR